MGDSKRIGAGRETASPGDIVTADTFIGRVTRRYTSDAGEVVDVQLDDGTTRTEALDLVTVVQRFHGPSSAVQLVNGAWLLSRAHMMAVAS